MSAAAPPLTVAMSVYNNGPFVGKAIDSILDQSFGDFEFLIVNDGSTDESGVVIEERAACDSRMRVIHQENRGFIASLNRMLAEARSPWIARMDGDDVSFPERFTRQMDFLAAHPDHGVISCAASLIGPDGEPVTRPPIVRPTTHEGLVANLESGPLINHNAVIYSREAVLSVGAYRSAYRHAEDYDLWLRLSTVTRMANLPEALVAYRLYPDQVSSRHVVAQARHAAIAWLAHCERLAGRPDPTEGCDTLPSLDKLDAIFGKGSAAYVRRRVIDRTLYSPEAIGGEGYEILIDHIAENGTEPALWRAAARLLKSGRPGKAAGVANALLRAG